MVGRTFSPARAWRLTVGPASTRTLGVIVTDSSSSKIKWIVVGTAIGTVAAMATDYWVKPLLTPKPALEVQASLLQPGQATFKVTNSGKAAAIDVAITIWAVGPFAAGTDIVSVKQSGGAVDARCEVGLYKARLMPESPSPVQSPFSTEAQALLLQCKRINAQEGWSGEVSYQGRGAVSGLLFHLKHSELSENKYALFKATTK